MLTESVLLTALRATAAILLSAWTVRPLVRLLPHQLALAEQISVDGPVFMFTIIVSLLTGIVFGLAPARALWQSNLGEALKTGMRTAGTGGRALRSRLVVVELALALVLLINADLLVQSFLRLSAINPGFQADHVLTMTLSVSPARDGALAKREALYREVQRRLEALPAMRSVAFIDALPLTSPFGRDIFVVEGHPVPAPGQEPVAMRRVVGADYFRATSIPLKSGRFFEARDRLNAAPVVIASEAMARKY